MFRNWILCAIAVVVSMAANSARATLFYSEPFNYPNGSFVNGTNGPNMPNPPFWQAVYSSMFSPVKAQISDGRLVIVGTGTPATESPLLPTGAVLGQGQTWYSGFDAFLGQGDILAGPRVLASFFQGQGNPNGQGNYTTTFYVYPPSAPSSPQSYEVGLGTAGSSATVWPDRLAFGWHRIVMSYTLDPDNNPTTDDSITKLWIDPVDENSPSIMKSGASYAANAFAFPKQSSGTLTYLVDNLNVGTAFVEVVPEPSCLCLVMTGIAALGIVRRKIGLEVVGMPLAR
jgi:hypothetical protein